MHDKILILYGKIILTHTDVNSGTHFLCAIFPKDIHAFKECVGVCVGEELYKIPCNHRISPLPTFSSQPNLVMVVGAPLLKKSSHQQLPGIGAAGGSLVLPLLWRKSNEAAMGWPRRSC